MTFWPLSVPSDSFHCRFTPLAAVVLDTRWSAVLKLEGGRGGWLAEQLARLQVRHPNVPFAWCDTRPLAEDWTFRFLGAALAQRLDEPDDPTAPRPPRRSSPDWGS
jgi:hypothetical protein